MMVQGHTFSALLAPQFRAAPWFRWHSYVHGLTAPLFFFSSGLAFGIATLRAWQKNTRWNPQLRRRYERYGWLLFIGSMLNLPHLSFPYLLFQASERGWEAFTKVDALQHIAVSLIIIQSLAWLTRRRGLFAAAVAALGAALVLLAPWAWRLPTERTVPVMLVGYINDHRGSIFPLFPWTGFICVGVLAAFAALRADGQPVSAQVRIATFLGGGVALWLTADALQRLQLNPFGEHVYWKTSPIFFLTRVGILAVVFGLLCLYEQWVYGRMAPSAHDIQTENPAVQTRQSPLQIVGQETLAIYVVHLILLYGSPFFRSIYAVAGKRLTPAEALGVFALILTLCLAFAFFWHYLKHRHPQRFRQVRNGLAISVLALSVLRR